MNTDTLYKIIRSQGGRITKLRGKILQILSQTDCLLSQSEIITHLHTAKLNPNRSTIFRELLFLTKRNIVIKHTLSDTDYFEIPQDHHHHLVCLKCHAITKITIGNLLQNQEKKIAKQFDYTIINHSLEFYGYCRHCRV